MGTFTTPQAERDNKAHKHTLPGNVPAAAEAAAVVLAEGYDDFDRPVYYEPINEPHWSFVADEHLADWHTETRRAVGELKLPVKVGGPCLPVAYFYRNGYKAFDGLRRFIDNTAGELDFYSFHVYDYVNWDGADIRGRITSGLPLEGVLDLVQNHAENEYGGPFNLVVSEHGGYITASQGRLTAEELGELLAGETATQQADPFAQTLHKRSVASHVLVSTAIANTLVFMDHPHVVKKAVPFILPESMGWNPRYYSTMYVPYEFEDRTQWVETRNTDFYKFFRDVSGNRVFVRGGDPDLQVRAFVDGDRANVVINNTSDLTHRVRLELPSAQSFKVRRYGRNDDYTPYLVESEAESLETLDLAPREAVVVGARFAEALPVKQVVNEIPCYGDRVRVSADEGEPVRFVVSTPNPNDLKYAVLRVGVTRPTGASPDVRIRVNGKRVSVPVEDAATRLDDGEREYASTKIAMVDPSWLRSKNRIEVDFPDGGDGTIGSVVLRVARREASLSASRVANRP